MNNISLSQKERLTELFNKNNIVAVYLFGSRAEGTSNEDSDYDFGILLEAPDKLAIAQILLDLEVEAANILNKEVDVIILNTATIEQKYLIFSRGIVFYCKDNDIRTDFEDIIIRDYLDFKPFLEQYRREFREAIEEGDFYAKP
ncbi:MAG: nucleotidyltransferase domain-containing protein [Bacillota bacterium]